LIHLADGTPINGLPYDRAGSDIDTTNPEAAKWYWKTIRDNIMSKGFDSLWADETEPDLPPNGATTTSGRARSSSTSIRSSTPPRSTTASARTSRRGAR
jgi:alpha-glucosidase (family GH31 glycosyl hydrolase)